MAKSGTRPVSPLTCKKAGPSGLSTSRKTSNKVINITLLPCNQYLIEMKTSFRAITVIAVFFSLCFLLNSCKKVDDGGIDLPKEQLIAGKWNINRIQLKIYNGSVFLKDTIIPQHPHPENF